MVVKSYYNMIVVFFPGFDRFIPAFDRFIPAFDIFFSATIPVTGPPFTTKNIADNFFSILFHLYFINLK